MDKQIYYRIISLWVLCEAMLGGIIHGLKIPVSGLIVGSCAVICICLIAYYIPVKGAILKATLLVAIFKMMLSPQAPPPAYIAVFFQGLMGELLFSGNRRFYKLSCILLGLLALLESGLQRILVLTIVYGNDLWKVINDFINGLTKQKRAANYSLLIGSGYVLLHLITGVAVGWVASVLPEKIERWRKEEQYPVIINDATALALPSSSAKKKRLKKGLFVVWILLIALYIQSWFSIGTPLLPSHIALKILLRSLIIVLSWIFIVAPLLKQLLHQWLQKKQTGSQREMQEVLQLLPATQQLVAHSWKRSADKKGWKRFTAAAKMILMNAFSPSPLSSRRGAGGEVYILTAPIQTGKTTSLIRWSEKRNDVYGILTPVVNGQRMFMNVHNRHLFSMEAKPGEAGVLNVGKYIFSKTNFDKAIQIIRGGIDKEGWLVIDEVGPMELKGEGFSEVLKEVLTERQNKLLLVVRERLVPRVEDYFNLQHVIIVTGIAGLREREWGK